MAKAEKSFSEAALRRIFLQDKIVKCMLQDFMNHHQKFLSVNRIVSEFKLEEPCPVIYSIQGMWKIR